MLLTAIPENNAHGTPAKSRFQFAPPPGLEDMTMWIVRHKSIPDRALVRLKHREVYGLCSGIRLIGQLIV
jgi:hypothetical protein